MPRSRPHSDRDAAARELTSTGPTSASDEVAADLRREVARLAEQVRRLGEQGTTDGDDDVPAPEAEIRAPVPPRPRGATTLDDAGEQVSAEAGPRPPQPAQTVPGQPPIRAFVEPVPPQPRRTFIDVELGLSGPPDSETSTSDAPTFEREPVTADEESRAPESAADQGADTRAERSNSLVASVLTLAELAAVEIRANAEVQAAEIRARSGEQISAQSATRLLALLERQRLMLAALTAQTDRLEQAGRVLRAQIRALDAERQHIQDVLAASRPPQ
jgi:hypothetical protein